MKRVLGILVVSLLAAATSFGQTPAQVEKTLLSHLKKIEGASNYGGTSDYDTLGRENKALYDALVRFGSRNDILSYPFTKLKEKMFVTTSKDGRFRAYSWDAETGGTMHDFLTVYHFRGANGKTRSWARAYDEEESAGAFVHQIFQINTNSTPIYLAVSTFIGSTSLAGQTIAAFRVEGTSLNSSPKVIRTATGLTDSISFGYDFFSVVDHPERPVRLFHFDERTNSFRFPVIIEDEKTPQGRVTDKFIRYRFDGKYFVKAS